MTKTIIQNIHAPVFGPVVGRDLTVAHCIHHHGPMYLGFAFTLKPDEIALLHNYRRSPKASQDILRHTSAEFAQSKAARGGQ